MSNITRPAAHSVPAWLAEVPPPVVREIPTVAQISALLDSNPWADHKGNQDIDDVPTTLTLTENDSVAPDRVMFRDDSEELCIKISDVDGDYRATYVDYAAAERLRDWLTAVLDDRAALAALAMNRLA